MRLYLSMSEAVMPNILFRSFMSQSGLGGGGSPCGGTPGAVFGAAFGGGPAGGPELVVLGADIMAAEVGGGGGPIGGGNGCGGGMGGPIIMFM